MRFSAVALLLASTISVQSGVPFADAFAAAGPDANWQLVGTATGAFTSEANGTDTVPASSASSDGFFGRITYTASTGGPMVEQYYLNGASTDANYSISVKLYEKPVLSAAFYRYVYFCGGAGKLEISAASPSAIKVIINGTTIKTWNASFGSTPNDFPDFPSGGSWNDIKIVLQGASATVFLNGTQLTGSADWSASFPSVTAGKYGLGIKGPGGALAIPFTARSYFDEFSVTASNAAVNDWTLY